MASRGLEATVKATVEAAVSIALSAQPPANSTNSDSEDSLKEFQLLSRSFSSGKKRAATK